MSHCGCSQLFVEGYKDGSRAFQILYDDNMARKHVYTYNGRGKVADTLVLIAKTDDFTTH